MTPKNRKGHKSTSLLVLLVFLVWCLVWCLVFDVVYLQIGGKTRHALKTEANVVGFTEVERPFVAKSARSYRMKKKIKDEVKTEKSGEAQEEELKVNDSDDTESVSDSDSDSDGGFSKQMVLLQNQMDLLREMQKRKGSKKSSSKPRKRAKHSTPMPKRVVKKKKNKKKKKKAARSLETLSLSSPSSLSSSSTSITDPMVKKKLAKVVNFSSVIFVCLEILFAIFH